MDARRGLHANPKMVDTAANLASVRRSPFERTNVVYSGACGAPRLCVIFAADTTAVFKGVLLS